MSRVNVSLLRSLFAGPRRRRLGKRTSITIHGTTLYLNTTTENYNIYQCVAQFSVCLFTRAAFTVETKYNQAHYQRDYILRDEY